MKYPFEKSSRKKTERKKKNEARTTKMNYIRIKYCSRMKRGTEQKKKKLKQQKVRVSSNNEDTNENIVTLRCILQLNEKRKQNKNIAGRWLNGKEKVMVMGKVKCARHGRCIFHCFTSSFQSKQCRK